MANVKFTGLPAVTPPLVATDLFAVSQSVSTTPVSRSVPVSTLIDDTAYTSAWSGATTAGASKNAIYTQLHKIDTADDGSIISASTGFRIAGAAASGKILIGNGTNFVASTPTYPNTSATAGKLIRSDGTNWIATTSTFPDQSASGKIIISDGTNFVASTPTYPNATSPTAGKVIVADGTNWVASTPTMPGLTGTMSGSGKVMVSDGTNWVASTPTFPNTTPAVGKVIQSDGTNWQVSTMGMPTGASAAAGKILVSDGSNWTASTPTFPNASATARKFIVSDGTNWVASTETQAAPGTAGSLLVSDGTNWTSKLDILTNSSTAAQAFTATEAIITGSLITIPVGAWTIGTTYKLVFDMAKTAGAIAFQINVRIGTAGTTADTAVYNYVSPVAQTAVADQGRFEFLLIVRTLGTTATINCVANIIRLNTGATGFFALAQQAFVGTGVASTTFNSTTATKISVSFSGGTSFAGTSQLVIAELNIA